MPYFILYLFIISFLAWLNLPYFIFLQMLQIIFDQLRLVIKGSIESIYGSFCRKTKKAHGKLFIPILGKYEICEILNELFWRKPSAEWKEIKLSFAECAIMIDCWSPCQKSSLYDFFHVQQIRNIESGRLTFLCLRFFPIFSKFFILKSSKALLVIHRDHYCRRFCRAQGY